MKTKVLLFFASIVMTVFAANADYANFRGAVGKYGCRGSITFYNGGSLSGWYSYDSHSNSSLSLQGSWYESSYGKRKITMYEIDTKGAVSGTWSLVYDVFSRKITGTMTNKKGTKYKVNFRVN